MTFDLPTTVEIDGKEYAIDADYRTIITICVALTDPDLDTQEKWYVALKLFYEDFDSITDLQEAAEKLSWFINAGEETEAGPRLMDWEQDFQHIVAPVNRIVGTDVRGLPFLHWWTFLSAYMEIGDCLFAQIVRIRDAQARGKKLDKVEREWARRNANMIRLKQKYSGAEDEAISAWVKGV